MTNRKTISMALAFALLCTAPFNAHTKQAVRFRNGDVLLGKLESIDSTKNVVWQRDDVFQPIELFGTNISEIRFSDGAKTNSSGTNLCRVHLRNGDWIEGALQQLNSENITLHTSVAGEMIFPRKFVQSLEPLPGEGESIFSGPTGLDGWTSSKVTAPEGQSGEWKYTNGAFYATQSASIARDVKLPDVARIQFDLAWKDMLQAAVALYTSYMHPINLANKDTEPDFGGFYSLQINNFVATMMTVKKKDPLVYLGQVPVSGFSRKNQAHVELLVNKPRASIALLVNGELVREWIDPEGFAGTGTAMRFVHQGQGVVKLSHLRITEWNGKIDEKPTNNIALTEDLARLLNGDKIPGTLESFRDGKLTFHTGKNKLDVPFRRVTDIQFAGKELSTTKTAPVIRAFFVGGGSVTFQLDRWDSKGVTGKSPNFGRATFTPSAFERVEFHPDFSTNKSNETDSPNVGSPNN